MNGQIYKIAGYVITGSGSSFVGSNAVEIYDIASNTWSPAANYPLSLGWVSAFTQNGFVYGAGGVDPASAATAKTYRYTPGTNTWSDGAIADLPATRWGAAYVRYNGLPVLVGGYVSDTISVSAITWDATSNTWQNLADMLQARARATGAVLAGSFFVIGGRPPAGGFNGTNDDQKLTCPPATFTVTTVDDHDDGSCTGGDCTLREAINAANARTGDDFILINFAPGVAGLIQLTAALPNLSSNIALQGPGANLLTVRRNSGGNYRIFNITSGVVVNLSGLTIANGNVGARSGGGISNVGTLTVANAAITGNLASAGGGIFNNFGALTITNSTISGNTVSNSFIAGSGGGIFKSGGMVTIVSSTISDNSAIGPGGNSDSGGGIITNVGTVSLTNSTISGNSGDLGGGIRNINGGTVTSRNTIIALNTSASGPDVNGPLTSQGYNLIGNASGAIISPAQSSDQIGVTAAQLNLGPLQNNGGSTQTHALLSGSIAIDKGNTFSLFTDQRGFIRPVDLSTITNAIGGDGGDIGAFEFGACR